MIRLIVILLARYYPYLLGFAAGLWILGRLGGPAWLLPRPPLMLEAIPIMLAIAVARAMKKRK